MLSSSHVHSGIVAEKEGRLREVMAIMGMRPWTLAASWAVAYGAVFALVSILGKTQTLPNT